ncbi:hypothetical protein M514_08001 [Trichuris suis]|uniref:Uncharacterized protein n=1 Tax=Trichuris suis TaxID=68888 RepID=A0A085N0S4_9BILA|nr:hypothetical protein M513_08001 [Trichuris suis]KFD63070.1 hypothetical protein M514_08001 [Trichuris suis]
MHKANVAYVFGYGRHAGKEGIREHEKSKRKASRLSSTTELIEKSHVKGELTGFCSTAPRCRMSTPQTAIAVDGFKLL